MKWIEKENLKDYFSRKIMKKKNLKIEKIVYLLNKWRGIFSKNFKWIANL